MKQSQQIWSRRSFIISFLLLLLLFTLIGCKNLSYTSVQPPMQKETENVGGGCSVGVQENDYKINYVDDFEW